VRRYTYLLGDRRREAVRLRAQARLWDPVSTALFDRLGVSAGWRVLKIGPGAGSLHLELRRRVRGPIDAVERSPVFASALARRTRGDRFGAGTIWQSDLIDAPLPRAHYDLIFARWVFLFLPNPEAHMKKLARALRPGGRIVNIDFHARELPVGPSVEHKVAREDFLHAAAEADLELVREETFLPHQYFLELRPR